VLPSLAWWPSALAWSELFLSHISVLFGVHSHLVCFPPFASLASLGFDDVVSLFLLASLGVAVLLLCGSPASFKIFSSVLPCWTSPLASWKFSSKVLAHFAHFVHFVHFVYLGGILTFCKVPSRHLKSFFIPSSSSVHRNSSSATVKALKSGVRGTILPEERRQKFRS